MGRGSSKGSKPTHAKFGDRPITIDKAKEVYGKLAEQGHLTSNDKMRQTRAQRLRDDLIKAGEGKFVDKVDYEAITPLFRKASEANSQLSRAETQLKAFQAVEHMKSKKEMRDAKKLVEDRKREYEEANRAFEKARDAFGKEKYYKIRDARIKAKLAELKKSK